MGIFKRIERIVKSTFFDFEGDVDTGYESADEQSQARNQERADSSAYSKAYAQALAELEEMLNFGKHSPPFHRKHTLAQDYANLEATPSMTIAEIKECYKKSLKKYHPDNYIGNAEKQSIANEITVKINESYERIMRQRKG